MTSEKSQLGGLCLDEYLSGPYSSREFNQEIATLEEEISSISTCGLLSVERGHVRLKIRTKKEEIRGLKLKRSQHSETIPETYPTIDLSFLTMANEIRHQDNIGLIYHVKVPRFSVYRVFGNNKFSVGVTSNPHAPTYDAWVRPFFLPKVIKKPLMENVALPFAYYATSYLNIGVPEETKEKISKAKKEFGRRNLFFVAETKPEDWNVQVQTKDPLVIGVRKKRAYLLDQFDTTPLENYVAREFRTD
jgi:hypothetical protein